MGGWGRGRGKVIVKLGEIQGTLLNHNKRVTIQYSATTT